MEEGMQGEMWLFILDWGCVCICYTATKQLFPAQVLTSEKMKKYILLTFSLQVFVRVVDNTMTSLQVLGVNTILSETKSGYISISGI